MAGKGGWLWALMLVVYIFLSTVGGVIIQAAVPSGTDLSASVAYFAITGALSSLAIFAVVAFACYSVRKEKKITDTVRLGKSRPVYYICAVFVAVGMLFGLGFVNGLVVELFAGWGIVTPDFSLPIVDVWSYLLFVLVYAVLPAVSEELFYRGVLVSSIGGAKNDGVIGGTGFKISAVATLAVCFALYHTSVIQFAYQLLYVVVLCLLAVKAKSVLPAILAHFLNNFAVLTFQFAGANVNLYSPWCIILGLLSLAIGLVLTFAFGKGKPDCATENFALKENSAEKVMVKENSVFNFWLPGGLIGGLICVALAVMGLMA